MNLNDLTLNGLHTTTSTSKTYTDEEIREQLKEVIKIGKELDEIKAKQKQEIHDLIKEQFPTVSDEYISIFAENALSMQHNIEQTIPKLYHPSFPIKLRDTKSLASAIIYDESSDLTMDYIELNKIIFKINNMEKHNEN